MRWIRLDACFDETWLFTLSAGAQLAWVKLLCTCKRDGTRGTMKALSHVVAARKWGVGEEDIAKMLHAAVIDGAIEIVDGKWVVTNWDRFQESDSGAAERMRRMRERKASKESETEREQDPKPVTDVTRNVTDVTERSPVTCRVTETETETETIEMAPSNAGGRARGEPDSGKFQPPTLEEVLAFAPFVPIDAKEAEQFWLHYESVGWRVGQNPMVAWRPKLAGWKAKEANFKPRGSGKPPPETITEKVARLNREAAGGVA